MTYDTLNSSQNERALLLKVLNTARKYTNDILNIEQKISEKDSEIAEYKNYGEQHQSKSFYREPTAEFLTFVLTIPMLAFFPIMINWPRCSKLITFFNILFNTDVTTNMVCCVLIDIILTFLTSFLLYIIYRVIGGIIIKKKIDSFTNEWNTNGIKLLEEKNKERTNLITEKNALLLNEAIAVFSLLPPKYIYLEAIDYFIEVIENMRADSIKEAVNLYEEHLHRIRIETAQNQIASQQSQLLQIQQENQAILNSIGNSIKSIDYSTQNISSDIERLKYLATINYLEK